MIFISIVADGKAIDIDRLYAYLCNVLKWSEKESKWCCDRIEIGLKILKVNKNFNTASKLTKAIHN